MARRPGFSKATSTTSFLVLAVLVLNCDAAPSPILDFLDPFLNTESKHSEIGGSGGLAASGHLGAGLGNSVGFNADGSVAASKGFGVGVDKNTGLDFNPNRHPHFQGDEHHALIPIVNQPHFPQPPPPQHYPASGPSVVPCNHERPHVQQPRLRPQNHRDFLKHARSILDKAILQKEVNNTTKNGTIIAPKDHKLNEVRSIQNNANADIEAVDVDKDGDIDDDDEDFLRQARSLLDKAILQKKVNNATKNATNISKDHSASKRSIPVLVLEEVHFVPLNKSSSHNETTMLNERRSIQDNSNESSHLHNATIEANNSTSNKTKEDENERGISPKFAHMFHNMFAG